MSERSNSGQDNSDGREPMEPPELGDRELDLLLDSLQPPAPSDLLLARVTRAAPVPSPAGAIAPDDIPADRRQAQRERYGFGMAACAAALALAVGLGIVMPPQPDGRRPVVTIAASPAPAEAIAAVGPGDVDLLGSIPLIGGGTDAPMQVAALRPLRGPASVSALVSVPVMVGDDDAGDDWDTGSGAAGLDAIPLE